MAKIDFKRRDVQGTLMREVIFRIDYTGVVDINDIVKGFIRDFNGLFNDYNTTYSNRLDLGNLDFQEISESLSVPVKEIERQTVHRFTGKPFHQDDAVFDICKYYSVFHLMVSKYMGLDSYLEFFLNFMRYLKEQSPFISFKRFGLRKTGAKVFLSYDSIFDVFERQYFCTEFEGQVFQKQGLQFVDVLRSNDERFTFTFKRLVDKGYVKSEDEIIDGYQATLDIDGFLDAEAIAMSNFENPDVVGKTISQLNDRMFELFKISVTEDYLKSRNDEPEN